MPENRHELDPKILKKFSPETGLALEEALTKLPPEEATACVEALAGLSPEQVAAFEREVNGSHDEQGEQSQQSSAMMERHAWHLVARNDFPEGMPFVSGRTYIVYYREWFYAGSLRGDRMTWFFGDTYAVDWLKPIILSAEEELDRLTAGRRFARLTTNTDTLIGRDPDTWWRGDETDVNCPNSVYIVTSNRDEGRRRKYPYKVSFSADGQRPKWHTSGELCFRRDGALGRMDLYYGRTGSGYNARFEPRDGVLAPIRIRRSAGKNKPGYVVIWSAD